VIHHCRHCGETYSGRPHADERECLRIVTSRLACLRAQFRRLERRLRRFEAGTPPQEPEVDLDAETCAER
jgi:hypothetical protein